MGKALRISGVSITDPSAPIMAPAVGVPGYTHRYRASSFQGDAGTVISAGWLNDLTQRRTRAPRAGGATLVTVKGERAVRLTGSATAVTWFQVDDAPVGPMTIVGVVRPMPSTGVNGDLFHSAGRRVRRGTNSIALIPGEGAATSQIAIAGTIGADDAPSVLSVVLSPDGTADAFEMSGHLNGAGSGPVAPLSPNTPRLAFGLSGSGPEFKIDMLDWLVYPRALTAEERATARTNLAAQHPAFTA